MTSTTPKTLANRIIAEFWNSPVATLQTTARDIDRARKVAFSEARFAEVQHITTGLGIYPLPRECSYPEQYLQTRRALFKREYPIHIAEGYNELLGSLKMRSGPTFAETTIPNHPQALHGYLIVPKGDHFHVRTCSFTGQEILMNVFVHRFAPNEVQTTTRMDLADLLNAFQISENEHESAVGALQMMAFTERA